MINNRIINRKRRCVSMQNTVSMDKCKIMISCEKEICGIHKKRKLLYLPDGSIWNNNKNSCLLSKCTKKRNSILFWKVIDCGVSLDKLNRFYTPETVSRLRVEKVSYLKNELKRLGVNVNEIVETRYYWFLNLLYYLGNFPINVKKIQRFCRGPFKRKLKKRKKAVKIIWKYYLNYKIKKLIPTLIYNGNFLKLHNCINLCDPITQDSFMDVHPERWVICQNGDTDNCWWFDISSAIQLLGSPGSHSGENPFNRQEYPPAFLFDIEEKSISLSNKYNDIKNLTLSQDELKNSENIMNDYYNYKRFKLHIKANKVFESLKELGYYFPRNIFLKYSLTELRILAAKLYECWHIIEDRERIRLFPPNGNIYPQEFTERIITCSNSILLKNTILNTLLKSITYQENYQDKLYACLKSLIILGSINEESHNIIKENGLCDCTGNHYNDNLDALEILRNLINEFV